MIRRPPRSTLFPTRRSSDLPSSWLPTSTTSPCTPTGHSFKHPTVDVCCDGGSSRPQYRRSRRRVPRRDRKSTRLNSSHGYISYAVFCLKKKKKDIRHSREHA